MAVTNFDAVAGALTGEVDKVGSQIEMALVQGSHWDGYGRCWYRKVGKLVEVHIGISLGSEQTVFTMPEGYRPSSNRFFAGVGANATLYTSLIIGPSGNVNVKPNSGYAGIDGIYFVED